MKLPLFVLSLSMMVPAIASADTEVVPTGSPAVDVANLSAALQAGGVVRLRAHGADGQPRAFELGSQGQLRITRDVEILGETTNGATTTIHGGWQALVVICADYVVDPNLWQYVCTTTPPRVAVRGIHFDGQTYAAVRHLASTHAEYTDNQFTNIVGGPFFPGATKAQGIWVNGAGFAIDSIRGAFVVEDNLFEDMLGEVGYGFVALGLAADLVVRGNTIRNADAAGVGVFFYSGKVVIENNYVRPGSGYSSSFTGGGNGIWITGYLPDGAGGTAWVRGNRVECENPFADGIVIAFGAHNTTVSNNHITMHGTYYGALTAAAVTGTTFSQNRVDGAGSYALDAFTLDPNGPTTSATAFIGNNISGFSSAWTDVFIDALVEDTLLIGRSGSVVDQGTNSTITGFTLAANQSPPGAKVRKALVKRAADLQAAAQGPTTP